jgi:hypothetical protein
MEHWLRKCVELKLTVFTITSLLQVYFIQIDELLNKP